MKHLARLRVGAVAVLTGLLLIAPVQASAAASSAQVREAQTIMTKFGIPTGAIDGVYGPQTGRGLCVARQLAGYKSLNRNNVDAALLAKMRTWNTSYTSLQEITTAKLDGKTTYLYVMQKCQAMIYVENGKLVRIMPVSTGMNAAQSDDGKSHKTPNGNWYLGYTQPGWSCSTIYPESCNNHAGTGMNSGVSSFGNMYNKRQVVGNILVHGSTSVPTYPASHGCIRVTIVDSDWMFKHVGNGPKPYIKVVGAY